MLHARMLSYLDEVARLGSVRKAADRLNVSASAISRQILALEEQVGTPLFDRSVRRLVPTAAGELLIQHVRETLKDMTRTQSLIEELKGLRRGSIAVALMSGLASNIVPQAVVDFRERNPRVEVKLRLMSTGEHILAAVKNGDAELGLGFDFPRQTGLRIIHAVTGRLGAVLSPDHPLAGATSLRLADCLIYPLILADTSTAIRPYISQAFQRLNLDPVAAAGTNSIELMRQMVMLSQSITFLTPFDIASERRAGRLVYVPIHEFEQHTQQLMLVESERRSNVLAGLFVQKLKARIDEVAQIANAPNGAGAKRAMP